MLCRNGAKIHRFHFATATIQIPIFLRFYISEWRVVIFSRLWRSWHRHQVKPISLGEMPWYCVAMSNQMRHNEPIDGWGGGLRERSWFTTWHFWNAIKVQVKSPEWSKYHVLRDAIPIETNTDEDTHTHSERMRDWENEMLSLTMSEYILNLSLHRFRQHFWSFELLSRSNIQFIHIAVKKLSFGNKPSNPA